MATKDSVLDAPEVVLLLGAGASSKAGVPLMIDFVNKFKRQFFRSHPDSFRTFSALIDRLAENHQRTLDLETVLRALSALTTDDLVAALAGGSDAIGFPLKDVRVAEQALRAFIRSECSHPVNRRSVRYLDPLLDFAEPGRILNVFSLNYDMAVETLAELHNVDYTDGFEPYWHPDALEQQPDPDHRRIALHKLHGSLTWYRRDQRRYVKISVAPPETGQVEYFDHEPANAVMIYPMLGKDSGEAPYVHLFDRLRRVLSEADTLVAIGYSFRDQEVTGSVLDALMSNPRLTLLLVSPDANEVLKRLRPEIPAHRILALSKTAESALAEGWLYREVGHARNATLMVAQAESTRLRNPHGARRAYAAATRYYQEGKHLEALRVVAETCERNVGQAAPLEIGTHPLLSLAGCLAFGLFDGDDGRAWWKLLELLFSWWEWTVLHDLDPQETRVIRRQPSYASQASQNWRPSAEDRQSARNVIDSYLTLESASADPLLTRLVEKIRLIEEMETWYRDSVARGSYESPTPADYPTLGKFVADGGPSHVCQDLAEQPPFQHPGKLDWSKIDIIT